MAHDGWSDDAIAAGLRRRDSRALEAIITRYSREIFYFMRLILNNVGAVQDVEECVSDLFVMVWQEHDAFDPQRGSFRTWLTMRAKYLALDRRRQLARRQAGLVALAAIEADPDGGDGAEHTDRVERQLAQEYATGNSLEALLERREAHEELRAALAQLSELDRQLVYLRYFRLASSEDIASQTGLTRHVVDTRLWRARKLLKAALREPIHGRV